MIERQEPAARAFRLAGGGNSGPIEESSYQPHRAAHHRTVFEQHLFEFQLRATLDPVHGLAVKHEVALVTRVLQLRVAGFPGSEADLAETESLRTDPVIRKSRMRV